MQFLIISDIHANFPALQAVLKDAAGHYQQIVCCGDIVGYNPHPTQVIDWTRANCAAIVRGNHDKVVAGIDDMGWFNEVAQIAARWTIDHLSPEQMEYLQKLDKGPLNLEFFDICHGSPTDEDEYVISLQTAKLSVPQLRTAITFFGHTHLQGGFYSRHGRVGQIKRVPSDQTEHVIEVEPDTLYLINPGSIGQPRDGDPRAGYALYDSDQRTIHLRRVPYRIEQVAEDIKSAALPEALAIRLFYGA